MRVRRLGSRDPNHVNLNISDIESSFSERDEDREWSQKQPPEQGLLSILFGPFSKHSTRVRV